MINKRQISKAIMEKTGWRVRVFGSVKEGYYHFYSDDKEIGLKLARFPSTSVYVYSINQLTLDQWVQSFILLLEDYEKDLL